MAKIYFYYAAMNAGKTTVLLQSSYNYRERGMRTLLFTPLVDDRFGTGRIESRIGLRSGAISVAAADNLLARVRTEHAAQPVACVLIDEAQFLQPEQVRQLHRLAHRAKLPVICYGLRSDFRGEAFPGTAALLTLADDLEEMKTICACARKASMNMRIDDQGRRVKEGEQVVIGGNERYRAVCPSCFYAADDEAQHAPGLFG